MADETSAKEFAKKAQIAGKFGVADYMSLKQQKLSEAQRRPMTITQLTQTPEGQRAQVDIGGRVRSVQTGDELPEGLVTEIKSTQGLYIQPRQGPGYWTGEAAVKGSGQTASGAPSRTRERSGVTSTVTMTPEAEDFWGSNLTFGEDARAANRREFEAKHGMSMDDHTEAINTGKDEFGGEVDIGVPSEARGGTPGDPSEAVYELRWAGSGPRPADLPDRAVWNIAEGYWMPYRER